MREFSSRVEAQRQLLKAVNSKPWKNEQLFSLNGNAIQRWVLANHIDPSIRLVTLLNDASAEVFAMANHSDDPVAGVYRLSKERVAQIGREIRRELGLASTLSVPSAF